LTQPNVWRGRMLAATAAAALLSVACGGDPAAPADPLAGLEVSGDPSSPGGATWTYRDVVGGVAYDLQGTLFKPPGIGPFPAIILSHGLDGGADDFQSLSEEMISWGLVAIATNYTHSGGGVPSGSPGTSAMADWGASQANVLRAAKCREILASLGYVDRSRVAAHGHSMGAFVTAALVGTYPSDFIVASHTAGGVGVPYSTTEAQARGIRAPYQMHHGDRDTTVPLTADQRLDSILSASSVLRELVVYPGAGHGLVPQFATVLGRIRSWYTTHGLLQ